MIYKNYLSFDVHSKDFEKQMSSQVTLDEYVFVLNWTRTKPISILNLVSVSNRYGKRRLIPHPINESDGSFAISIGHYSSKEKVTIYFEIFAFDSVQRAKTLIANRTKNMIISQNPKDSKKFQPIKKNKLWADSVSSK